MVQSLVQARLKYFERFQLVCSMVKSDLKDNISPGTVCGICCNSTTGKVSFVDDLLSSEAINAL
jgi:hypothetical protein